MEMKWEFTSWGKRAESDPGTLLSPPWSVGHVLHGARLASAQCQFPARSS